MKLEDLQKIKLDREKLREKLKDELERQRLKDKEDLQKIKLDREKHLKLIKQCQAEIIEKNRQNEYIKNMLLCDEKRTNQELKIIEFTINQIEQNRELVENITKIINRLSYLKDIGAFYTNYEKMIAVDEWILETLEKLLEKTKEVE